MVFPAFSVHLRFPVYSVFRTRLPPMLVSIKHCMSYLQNSLHRIIVHFDLLTGMLRSARSCWWPAQTIPHWWQKFLLRSQSCSAPLWISVQCPVRSASWHLPVPWILPWLSWTRWPDPQCLPRPSAMLRLSCP